MWLKRRQDGGERRPTRADVQWCYRAFLNREPESEAVLLEHLRHRNLDTLVRVFIDGPEFAAHFTATSQAEGGWPRNRVPLSVPALDIEVRASAEQLGELLMRTRRAWTRLGDTQPHFSVITAPQFLPESIDASLPDFLASGIRDVDGALAMLRRHGLADTKKLDCVEFGCGVGRMTAALAARFGRVIGYDISVPHLALARGLLAERSAGNVELVHCAHELLMPLAPCDVFVSLIVFQHNPPPVMRGLVANALAALKPGGLALFQLPTHIVGYEYRNEKYLSQRRPPEMEMHCLPQAEVFAVAREQECAVLEVREDLWTARPDMFVSNSFVIGRAAARS